MNNIERLFYVVILFICLLSVYNKQKMYEEIVDVIKEHKPKVMFDENYIPNRDELVMVVNHVYIYYHNGNYIACYSPEK